MIGIMQGRLLPPIDNRIQAFPWEGWPTEFELARKIGFTTIEFIFEGPSALEHPLLTESGRRKIIELVRDTGVAVGSICADYFMSNPIHGVPDQTAYERVDVLLRLIDSVTPLGNLIIELPCVDQSTLGTQRHQDELVERLSAVIKRLQETGQRLTLETDLPPLPFRQLLERFEGNVGANYDMGNSASLGYDPRAEIRMLGALVWNVHVKDRIIAGGTVPLGEGDARLEDCFTELARANYSGDFILQVARQPNDLAAAATYRRQVIELLKTNFPVSTG